MTAPGAYRPLVDVWGRFETLARRLPVGAGVVIDARVAALHPPVLAAIAERSPRAVVKLQAGEGAKRLATLERLATAFRSLPRGAKLLCVGGGTLGDVSTVAAQLLKRGLSLVHVPTTYLAAVDSSVGGKGAVNAAGAKNALGVFHYPVESWLCAQLFETLTAAQAREGLAEAVKMAVCLEPAAFAGFEKQAVMSLEIIRQARRLKARVCAVDPYEHTGKRAVLNFGHTLGHAIEAASGFRVRHGEAVALGMLCALDVGRRLHLTNAAAAQRLESVLHTLGAQRRRLRAVLKNVSSARLGGLLEADKKVAVDGHLHMVLLAKVGRARVMPVALKDVTELLPHWKEGVAS